MRWYADVTAAAHRDPAAGPPLGEESLLIAYEAGLWQLLELFFLSSDTPEGFFAEVHAMQCQQRQLQHKVLAAAAALGTGNSL